MSWCHLKVDRDTYLQKKIIIALMYQLLCTNYQNLKEQRIIKVMVLVVSSKGQQEHLHLL